MSRRALRDDQVDEVVRAARRFAGSEKQLKQAARALAVLRADGFDALAELLDRDLPEAMSGHREWRAFRQAATPVIGELHQQMGDAGVQLFLAWVERRARIGPPTAKQSGPPRPRGAPHRGRR